MRPMLPPSARPTPASGWTPHEIRHIGLSRQLRILQWGCGIAVGILLGLARASAAETSVPGAAPDADSAVQEPAPDPCAKWELNGYRLGMTKADALAVRSTKKPDAPIVQVVEKGKFSGTLWFDQKGLRAWSATYSTGGPAALRAALVDKLGAPTLEDPIGTVQQVGSSYWRYALTTWIDVSCDAAISLVKGTSSGAYSGMAVANVSLQRPSDAARGAEHAKEQASELLK